MTGYGDSYDCMADISHTKERQYLTNQQSHTMSNQIIMLIRKLNYKNM